MKTFTSSKSQSNGVDGDVYYMMRRLQMTKRRSLEEQYELVLECRKSGLSDRDWCFSNGIPQSTFYLWLRKLRDQACYKIPETESRNLDISNIQKQEVVRLNMYPENPKYEKPVLNEACSSTHGRPAITIEIEGIRLSVENYADPTLLAQTLKMIRGFIC
jgi:hypothetical protein